jgi:hypothetical protein
MTEEAFGRGGWLAVIDAHRLESHGHRGREMRSIYNKGPES